MSQEKAPRLLTSALVAVGSVAAAKLVQGERARNQKKNQSINDLREQATHDALTGLPNRRAFVAAGEALASTLFNPGNRSGDLGGTGKEIRHSVLLIDLDHFKEINDKQGHAKGDKVLRTVADILQESRRERDVVARVGGEELAVLLPRATEEDAANIAETLRGRIAETGDVTASIGVAELDLIASDFLNAGLAQADQALYVAKEQGRDQVVAYSALPGEPVALF